ncbi:MAG: group II truncated hemoglobin [Arenicellales bacterium]
MTTIPLGFGDNTYKALGEYAGLSAVVNSFYDIMSSASYAQKIRAMHPEDITLSREKLITFLSGWTGGPREYSEKFGGISIPGAHAHININEADKNAWLKCMDDALIKHQHSEEVRGYLIAQLSRPAQRIVEASAAYQAAHS